MGTLCDAFCFILFFIIIIIIVIVIVDFMATSAKRCVSGIRTRVSRTLICSPAPCQFSSFIENEAVLDDISLSLQYQVFMASIQLIGSGTVFIYKIKNNNKYKISSVEQQTMCILSLTKTFLPNTYTHSGIFSFAPVKNYIFSFNDTSKRHKLYIHNSAVITSSIGFLIFSFMSFIIPATITAPRGLKLEDRWLLVITGPAC